MQAADLIALIHQIQSFQCEFQTVEVKSANRGCPTRLYDTLSSFSNQDSGGVIVFGIEEQAQFQVAGVYDAQDLQKKVTEQCRQMEPAVRPLFSVCEYNGKTVVSAEIPGVDITERPVFYKGAGRLRGSYIRVGEADEPMNEYEIYSYDAFRSRTHDDLRTVENASLDFFDRDLLARYLAAVKQERKNIAEHVTDQQILELMGVTKNGRPTMAGLMVFSRFPQASFPQLCITAVVVPGVAMGETGSEGERFLANQRITGSIGEMLEDAVDFVRRNGRTKTIIEETGRRNDKPEFPPVAVREAILNALVHRDYSTHSETVPVRIVMYEDRMEIINSGGLYGRIAIDQLGKKVRPDTRNPTLANILELLRITENRYSGIPTIIHECEKARIPAPLFSVKRGEFIVTFRNNYAIMRESGENREKALLMFCQQPRSREEVVRFLGFTPYYSMSKIIRPLLEQGALAMTIPEKPKSNKQKFYTVTKSTPDHRV